MDCDCGATEWANVHSPGCAYVRFSPRHLDLTDLKEDVRDGDPHRPRISVWIDDSEIGNRKAKTIAMTIGELWGQHVRFVDLMPAEARRLALYLNEMADALDSVTGDVPRQPIETAPKDGSKVKLWNARWTRPISGYWDGTEWLASEMTYTICRAVRIEDPTHWEPND